MPSKKTVDRVSLVFHQGTPVDDALRKAARLAKKEYDAREAARKRLATLHRKSVAK